MEDYPLPEELSQLYLGQYGGAHDIIIDYLGGWSNLTPDSKLYSEMYSADTKERFTLMKPKLVGNRLYIGYTRRRSMFCYFNIDDGTFNMIEKDSNDMINTLSRINEYRYIMDNNNLIGFERNYSRGVLEFYTVELDDENDLTIENKFLDVDVDNRLNTAVQIDNGIIYIYIY